MVVLRAIGRFFCRIGRWIRDTAWVQPLLIVGGIFAIIFCIKPISNAVSGWFKGGNEANEFYTTFKVSLENADKNNGESEADKLISRIEKNEIGKDEKFFLSFVKEDCENCKACYEGFETLRSEWNTGSFKNMVDGSKGYKMYTIYIDQTNSDGELLIDDLLLHHSTFFDQLNSGFMEECDSESYYYYRNMIASNKETFKTQLQAIADTIGAKEEEEAEGFVAPTTYLIDGTANGLAHSVASYPVTACMFNYTIDAEGSSEYNKAYFVRDCWNYDGMFSKNYERK